MFEWLLRLDAGRELAPPFPIRELEPDLELENVAVLLRHLCVLLEDSKIARHHLRCGGEAAWPVDVASDLAMLLEGLVPALRALAEPEGHYRFELEERGIETALEVDRQGPALRLRAVDLWDARPSRFGSAEERLPVGRFALEVEALLASLGEAIHLACPALLDEELLAAWLRDVRRALTELRRSEA